MNRLTNSTKSADLFGTGKDGYTDGVPAVTAATILDSASLNPIQEEIARSVEDAGVALNTADLGQMSQIMIGRMELAELMNPARVYSSGGSDVMRSAAMRDTGLIALVGDAGKIFTTPNFGVSVTSRTAGSGYTGAFSEIVWTGSAFVAIGATGEIQTSPDGVTWTHKTSGTAAALSALVTDGTGTVLAFGDGGVNLTSTDHGATWGANTAINSGTWFAARAASDSSNPGVWIVAGNPGSSDLTRNIYRSVNGTGWAAISLSLVLPAGYAVVDVASRQGRGFVALASKSASSDKVLTSDDGLTWTLVATIAGGTKRLVVGRALIALISLPAIYTSYDGATWTEHRSLGWATTPNRFQYLQVFDTSLFIAHAITTDAGEGNVSRTIPG